MRTLLDNVLVDGSSAAYKWVGGRGALVVNGVPNGATVTLEIQDLDGNWIATATALTAAGLALFELPPCNLRVTISSAGASTDLSAWVSGTDLT